MTTITKITGVLLALALLAGCGGNDDDTAEPEGTSSSSTTRAATTPTTTAPPTPEELFATDMERQLTGLDDSGLDQITEMASSTCGVIERVTADVEGDTVRDLVHLTLTVMRDESPTPVDVDEVIMRSMADHLCPDFAVDIAYFLETIDDPLSSIGADGNYEVGDGPGQVLPGTWSTADAVSDCYWERVDGDGGTIDNDFVNGAPTVRVTISPSDAGFNTDGCGSWVLEE